MRREELALWIILILSMYLVPYVMLRDHKGIGIYVFWTVAAIVAIALAWRGVSRWERA